MLSTKQHRRETEYRRSYRNSQYNCSATTYRQNLDFRREQKRRFVEHNPDPFDWDPEDVESDDGSDFICQNLNRPSSLTHMQYKHEKLNQLYEKRLTNAQDSGRSGAGMNEMHSNGQEKDLQSSKRSHRVVVKEETDDDDSGSESDTSVVHIIEPEVVKKSSTKLSLPLANKQTQTERKISKQEVKQFRPGPFLPYGYEADATETGKKLTHNIRAAREIYPSALRAQRLRKAKAEENNSQAISGQVLSGRSSQASNNLRKANSEPLGIFVHNEYDDGDANQNWVSEYDRNYRPYPEKEYVKSANIARIHSREFIPRITSQSQKPTRK